MSDYQLRWITENIATGRAPMSYEELDDIRRQGVGAIVNLCGEFSDLHEIEENSGFEVIWIPTADETAPAMEAMEQGLEWLDEAVYLGKKVLIHCRHGIGRTGTFITAYLLRRGFTMKKAAKLLKATCSNPTNFSQWWLLRKYGKKEGRLTLADPTPYNRKSTDLSKFFEQYESLRQKVDVLVAAASPDAPAAPCCDESLGKCSEGLFSLELIEALYINDKVNTILPTKQRQAVIAQAMAGADEVAGAIKTADAGAVSPPFSESSWECPLHHGGGCLLHDYRPLHCRLRHYSGNSMEIFAITSELSRLSHQVFEEFFGYTSKEPLPQVSYKDALSGKFVQKYFQFIVAYRASTQQ